jgi:hypothetical protein
MLLLWQCGGYSRPPQLCVQERATAADLSVLPHDAKAVPKNIGLGGPGGYLYGLLRLLRGEPVWDKVRFGVGAHDPVEGLRSNKLEPLRFPLVLIRQGRILPVRVRVCPFD